MLAYLPRDRGLSTGARARVSFAGSLLLTMRCNAGRGSSETAMTGGRMLASHRQPRPSAKVHMAKVGFGLMFEPSPGTTR